VDGLIGYPLKEALNILENKNKIINIAEPTYWSIELFTLFFKKAFAILGTKKAITANTRSTILLGWNFTKTYFFNKVYTTKNIMAINIIWNIKFFQGIMSPPHYM